MTPGQAILLVLQAVLEPKLTDNNLELNVSIDNGKHSTRISLIDINTGQTILYKNFILSKDGLRLQAETRHFISSINGVIAHQTGTARQIDAINRNQG